MRKLKINEIINIRYSLSKKNNSGYKNIELVNSKSNLNDLCLMFYSCYGKSILNNWKFAR